MLRENYPERFTLGLVTTGGSLGILFPPSVPLLIYGIVAQVPVNKLMVAGLVPGLLVLAVLCTYGIVVGLRVGFTPHVFSLREALHAVWVAKWELAIPVVLLGGFGSGALRIYEATVVMALYVLFIEVVIYRDIDLRRDLPAIANESITLVGAILVIMACAVGFMGFLIQVEVPMRLVDFVQSTISSRVVFFLMLNACLVLIGMLMEIFAALVIAVPLVLPVARAYGIDPFHFGIMFVLSLEIAYLMPPLGLNLFISSIRFGRSITSVYRAVLGFIVVLFATLMLVSYVPSLATWLPSHVKGDDVAIGSPLTDEQRQMLGVEPDKSGEN
jgi:C4-dicarboxylate transporter, DctM subunit